MSQAPYYEDRNDGRQWFEIGVSVKTAVQEVAVDPEEAAHKATSGFDTGDLEDPAVVDHRVGTHIQGDTIGEDRVGWEFDMVSFGVFWTPAFDEAEIGEATVKRIDTGDYDCTPSLNYSRLMHRDLDDVDEDRVIPVEDWEDGE